MSESNESREKAIMEAAQAEVIQKSWKEFRFPGDPPRPGTPVEKRMIDTAKRYIDAAFGPNTNKHTASDVMRHASETQQRVYHNELAIMIYGQARTGMEFEKATGIKDFAAAVAYPGFSIDQIHEMLNSQPREE